MPSLQSQPLLWQESLLLPQTSICRNIPLQPPASRTENVQFAFSLQQTGGAARLGTGGVAWQIDNGSAGSLLLSVFCLDNGSDGERAVVNQHPPNHHPNPPTAQISLDFPTQIFPGVACVEHQYRGGALGTMVVGITATGIAFSVDLQHAMQLQGSAGNSAAGEQAFIRYADLSTYWPSVGSPSCIASADGHVLVGGALGPLLCLPLTWLQDPSPIASNQPFELRESGWGIKSFIAGVLQRQQSPSAVAVSPLHSSGSRGGGAAAAGGMIVATYDDCKLRGFSLSRQTQLFTESLELSPAAAAARAVPVFSALHMDPPSHSLSSTDAQASGVLVVQHECRDALHRSLAAYHVTAVTGGHRLVVRQRTDLAAPAAASTLSAAVCGSTIWVLLKVARGGTRLVGFDRGHGRLCATAALAEAGMLPHKLVKEPEGGDAMLMALWESSLAASINATAPAEDAPDAEGSPIGGPSSAELAAVAAHQVLARLLSAGGGLCRLSLRDALAYHGAQMTVVEAETVPLKRLSTYAHATVHAIQRRSPNVSPARCWLAFLGSYQEAWGRRHAPLCLLPPASSAGQQLNPNPSSPLCLLRGSCMLAAVRETAPVEALAMDASDLSASSMGSSPDGTGLGGHGTKASAPWHGGGGPAAAFEGMASSPSSASAAAALVAESVLPPPLHPVHRAARGLTRLLGPLSLDAFVSSLTPTPTPMTSHTKTDSSASGHNRGAVRAARGSGACVFEGGADAAAVLAPAYATMVLEGPAGVVGGSRAGMGVGVGVCVTDDLTREQRVGWRQRRQKALLALGQELGELPDLVGSIRAYCAYLTPQSTQVDGGTSTMQGPPLHQSPAAATLVAAAARQLARAQMSAARDVLVLLGVLTQLGAVGSTPLTAQQVAELQGSVYGEVAVLLQQATLAFWLCSTHATAATPAASTPQAPALEPALAFLRLGDSKEGGPRQLQQQQQQLLLAPHRPAGRDVSLVARLLPSLASKLPTSTLALCCAAASARALLVALQQGGSEATPTPLHITPSISSRERGGMRTQQALGAHGATPLPVRVLQVGYQLFLANEHAPLMGLTRLAQAATASLPRSSISASVGTPGAATHQAQGPEFLRGLSLACRLGGAPHEERQKRVSQAAGCFFRAAASLDPAGRGAQALVHATVLRSLRQLLTGYPEHEDDQQEHAPFASAPSSVSYNTPSNHQAQQQRAFALLQVQLYEVVMMLFEREGAPEGAVIFARAALQHLPTAYGHHHPPTQQQQAGGREQQPTGAAAAAAGAGPSGAVALGGQQGWDIMPEGEQEVGRARSEVGVGPQGVDGRESMAIDNEAAHGPSSAGGGGGGGASRSERVGVKVGNGVWRRRRQQQLRVREARLWSNIFKYCCELAQWEDAYAALVCNPDPQRALECLRQLVKELSERGEVLTLCALPLASAVCMQPPEEEEHNGPEDSSLQGSRPTHTPAQGAGISSMATPVGPSASQAQKDPNSSTAGGEVGVGRKRGRAGLEEDEGLLGSTATAPLVSLLQEVVAALQRRALNMDLTTQPQPYRLLYDFFVARSDMRGAARAMVAYARRLRSEGPPGAATVAEALTAYELALNALALQDPDDAWLDVHSDLWLAAHTVPGATPPAFPLAGAAGLDGGPDDVGADGPAGTSASAVGARVGVVAITHHALTLEYVLMRASAEVVATGASPGTDPLQAQRSPSNVLSQLLGVRAYDSAHHLTLCAWPEGGAQQMRALEALAGAMAREAARLQLQGEGSGDAAGILSGSPFSTQTEGAPSFSHPQQPQQQQQHPTAHASTGGPSSGIHHAPAPSPASPLPLLPPMPAVGLGAQDPGLVEGLWGQSLMGSRAAPAWAKLRALLAMYAGTAGLGSAPLRCSAAAAILREDPRMHLPPWLLDMFQGAPEEAGGAYEGMASAGCGPAELLDIYMAADRLEDAVAVVAQHVSRWSSTDPRLRRGRLAAAWFPHRRIKALRQRLRAAGADTSALDSAMAHHLEVLEHDAPVAQLPGPSSSNAGQLGLFGAPFEPAMSFH